MEEIDWKSIAAALAESLEDFLEHHDNSIGQSYIHPESLPNLTKVYHALKNYYDATHHEVSSETVGEWEELH